MATHSQTYTGLTGIVSSHGSIQPDMLKPFIDAGWMLLVDLTPNGPEVSLSGEMGTIRGSLSISTYRNRLHVIWYAAKSVDGMIRHDGKSGDIAKEVDKLLAAIEELRTAAETTS